MATKTTITKTEKTQDINSRIEKLKKTVNEVNDFVLETSEEIVDGFVDKGGKWQQLASKAIKGGLKLAASQQEIVFETLDGLKGQVQHGKTRFNKLFSKN